jgi:hypothetical protein
MFRSRVRLRQGIAISTKCGAAAFVLLSLLPTPTLAQKPPTPSAEPSEMIATSGGLLAIQTPDGWVRTEGPGLAFFIRRGETLETSQARIYISSEPIGPHEDAKDLQAYIKSDVAGFKERFKSGVVHEEAAITLPGMKTPVPVYTFQSNDTQNSFEQVIYIPELDRALLLVLSATSKDAFAGAMQDFRAFAKSYRGSIRETDSKKP